VNRLHHRDGHHGWDRDREPIAQVAPGEEIEVALADCFGGQLGPDATPADVTGLDLDLANPLTGPIAIDGARVGDAVGVELRSVDVGRFGWTALIPGFGLLADEFPEPHVITSHIGPERIRFGEVAELPTWPFLGTVGLAPAEPGTHSVIPPRRVGGNLDCRDVRPGAILWLPVEVDGAKLSAGDPHAAQGDGEVCGTAVETTATAVLRIHLRRGAAPAAPVIDLPAESAPAVPRGPRHVTTGVGPDLYASARDATRAMIDHLGANFGLDAVDAYALCSVAGHLRIAEVVDAPNWVVAMDLDVGVLL
jgi:acetamidase/formamidase